MAKSAVVLSYEDILLHQSDLDLLDGPYWLNDTIISFYFEYLQKIAFSHANDLLFVSPEVTQCIKLVPSEEIKTFLEPHGMHKKKFVFFPLNDNNSPEMAGGTHWSLLVYSKPENSFLHIDSSQMWNDGVAFEFVRHMIPYLQFDTTMEFINKESVQQSNGYDCGIHVICNAEILAEHAYQHGEIESCNLLVNICPSVKRKEIADIIRNFATT